MDGGVDDVIRSFFTRMITRPDDVQFTVPAGVELMLLKRGDYKSAGGMVRDLEAYMRGEDTFGSGRRPEEVVSHFSLLARGFKDDEMLQQVQQTDFSAMSQLQIDLMEATIYTRQVVRSGEPQAIDKYALGYI